MTIRVGDYVWCQDIEEYGFVELVKRAAYPDITDFVRVRMESDGAYRYYIASELVIVNTPPMCESASDKSVEDTDLPEENVRFNSPVSKEAGAKVFAKAESDEVRQTSDSGAQKGSKLARYDMIPADALKILAKHYGIGAEKYPPFRSVDEEATAENIRKAVQKECNCGH